MWGIVLLIFFVAGSRQLSITEFSVPDAVESGADVLLQCGYELSSNETAQGLTVKWWFTEMDESEDEPILLYQRIAGQPPVTAKDGIEIMENDDILLKSVTPDSSGTYECEVSAIEDEKRQHDDLIVFSKGELVLNITEVEDGPDEDDDRDILITCEATNVAPYPVLVITVNNEVLTTNDTVIDQDNSTYDAINNVTMSKSDADGAEISCELFYRNTTLEQYKITRLYEASRVNGLASSFLLVISALLINIFAIKI
ncbi:uncharacterized protein LOC120627706 isoform X2 [Pararge aegeria]|uniref:uncharacterized protein LOC120627706 isoform X2 n=1 Tax=Pararge aegeria TaxID=116150 RepID=UPI0019CF50CC|nr:uncharacterized protein LOC120627706 isoform X2 [Pararge aegeria]